MIKKNVSFRTMGPPFNAPAHHRRLLVAQWRHHPPPLLPRLHSGKHQERFVAGSEKLSTLSSPQKSVVLRICLNHSGNNLDLPYSL